MRGGLTALLIIALSASTASAQDCGLKQYDSIQMEVAADRILLPLSLGGEPKQMVFEIQNGTSALGTSTVEKMGLRRTEVPESITFIRDGAKIRYTVHVPEVQFGRQIIKSMEFLEVPSDRYGDNAVGAIGTRLFKDVDFEIDMGGGKFNLFSTDHCPGKAVYWTKSGYAALPIKVSKEIGYIRVPMELDGQPLTVALSSSGRSQMGMNAMRRMFNIDETSPALVPLDQEYFGNKLYRYAFKNLNADGLTVQNPDILVVGEAPRRECSDKLHVEFPNKAGPSMNRELYVRCFGGEDAILGLSVLKKLHLYVSGKEKLLYLTSAEAK